MPPFAEISALPRGATPAGRIFHEIIFLVKVESPEPAEEADARPGEKQKRGAETENRCRYPIHLSASSWIPRCRAFTMLRKCNLRGKACQSDSVPRHCYFAAANAKAAEPLSAAARKVPQSKPPISI